LKPTQRKSDPSQPNQTFVASLEVFLNTEDAQVREDGGGGGRRGEGFIARFNKDGAYRPKCLQKVLHKMVFKKAAAALFTISTFH
jgi:hypothetical protein